MAKSKDYDDKLKGVLFFDEKGKRDFAGELTTEDGTEYWISGWKHKSKAGQKYISLSLTKKDEVDNSPSNKKGKGSKDTSEDW